MRSVRAYFIRSLLGCFKWSGDELCWSDNTTVAFTRELLALLKLMPQDELPDFSSVALAMAVGRKSWPEASTQIDRAVSFCISAGTFTAKSYELLVRWQQIRDKLKLLSAACQHNSLTPAEKLLLLSLVIHSRDTKFTLADRAAILNALEDGAVSDLLLEATQDRDSAEGDFLRRLATETWSFTLSADSWQRSGTSAATGELTAFLRIAHHIAKRIPSESVDDLISLVRTGVPSLEGIGPARDLRLEQQDASSRVKALMKELVNHPDLGAVARLASRLTASVSLPRRMEHQEQLPIGGVSDIANRGQLDKLLLSELAHDDLIMSVRVALNEALYLRRESPSCKQPISRWVFLDSSLPMWGIPRLYAVSAVLALHVTSDSTTQVRCLSLRNSSTGQRPSELIEISLLNQSGIMEQMSTLGTASNPIEELVEFFKQAQSDPAMHEPVVVTAAEIMQSKQFRLELDELWSGTLWIIVVHRSGRLEILKKSSQGLATYRKVELQLDEIISPRVAAQLKGDQPSELPAAVLTRPFPLLLSHQMRANRAWKWGEQTISISDDGRVMLWSSKNRGAKEIFRGLSAPGDCFLIERGQFFSVLYWSKERRATLIRLSIDGEYTTVDIRHELQQISDLVLVSDYLLIFGIDLQERQAVCMADYPGGMTSTTVTLGDHSDRCGRWLRSQNSGFYAAYATQIGGEFVLGFQLVQADTNLKQVFQFKGRTVSLDSIGNLRLSDGTDPFQSPGTTSATRKYFQRVVKISTDETLGEFVIKSSGQRAVIDLEAGEFLMKDDSRFFSTIGEVELARSRRCTSFRVPHYRFSSVGTNGVELFLQNARGQFSVIISDRKCREAVLTSCGNPQISMLKFGNPQETHGCKLQQVTWPSGSVAWLDWRGVLHLQPADPDIAEVTITLRDGAITGWTSVGDYFGDSYSTIRSGNLFKGDEGWNRFVIPILESMV